MCGELEKAMHGTRDAAQNWEHEYCEFMGGLGFERGKSSPCAFYHREREIRAVIHGDDFTLLGWKRDLDWYRKEISNRFEIKFRGRLGPGKLD